MTRSRKIRWDSLATCDATERGFLDSRCHPRTVGANPPSQLVGTTFPFHLSPNLFVISLRCGASYSSFLAAWPALHSFLCPLLSPRPPTLPILHPGKYSAGWLVFLRSVLSISSDRAYLKCLVVLSEISGSSIGFHPPSLCPRRTFNGHSLSLCCPHPTLSVSHQTRVWHPPHSSRPRAIFFGLSHFC